MENVSREHTIARKLWELELARKELESKLEEVKNRQILQMSELKDVLLEEGKASTGFIEGIGEFSLKKEAYPSVTAAVMPSFISWLNTVGDKHLVKQVVDARTLKKYLTDKMEALSLAILETRAREDLNMVEKQKAVWKVCLKHIGMTYKDKLNAVFNVREGLTQEDMLEMESLDLAVRVFGVLGVTNFVEFKVSHTSKGKTKFSK